MCKAAFAKVPTRVGLPLHGPHRERASLVWVTPEPSSVGKTGLQGKAVTSPRPSPMPAAHAREATVPTGPNGGNGDMHAY